MSKGGTMGDIGKKISEEWNALEPQMRHLDSGHVSPSVVVYMSRPFRNVTGF